METVQALNDHRGSRPSWKAYRNRHPTHILRLWCWNIGSASQIQVGQCGDAIRPGKPDAKKRRTCKHSSGEG